MPDLSQQSEKDGQTDSSPSPDASRVDPAISAKLRADYDALLNDVQQANEMAADFQRQLAGKSNEFALLKQVFEKAREDLGKLQSGIAALRQERHRLANEAAKAEGYKAKMTSVTAERNQLRIELETLRNGLNALTEEMTRAIHFRDKQIAELTVEIAILKQAAQGRPAEAEASTPALRQPKTAATERFRLDGEAD